MQFSLAPWDFGENCNILCRRYAELHEELAPTIIRLAKETIQSGYPIIRPVFWRDPSSEQALTCDDEFLLGDEILIAPVVRPNMRQRNIFLPPGTWKDHWTSETFDGPTILEGYPAPLDTLPMFFLK
jgi:alpha-glucosidase (family GH31 glycosyl hydrolase)